MALSTHATANQGEQLSPPAKYEPNTNKILIADRYVRVGGPLPRTREGEKLLTYTLSLCPVCYRLLPAIVFEKDEKVFMRKICPEHGEFEELYYGDAKMYKRFLKYTEEGRGVKPYVPQTAPCPFNCGLCPRHLNHTALANLVATNRCDLSCWYCFFYAERVGYVYEPSLEQIRYMVRQLKKQGVTMAVQITGGEPTLREDLVEIVKILKDEGVTHIQLNTHGIKFAKLYFDEGLDKAVAYARALREAGVNTVYLSFDGVTPRTNPKNHWEVPFILEVFRKAGMTSVVLVPTVIKGYNDFELGDIIRFAAKHMDVVRGVNFQPVSLTGMLKHEERRRLRVTIPDVIKWVEEQTNGEIYRDAWFPVPVAAKIAYFLEAITGEEHFCMGNHPVCGAATYVFVERDSQGLPKRFLPITEFFDIEGFIEYIDSKRDEFLREGVGTASTFKKMLKLSKLAIDISKFIDKSKLPKELNITKLIINVFVKRSYDALARIHYSMLFLGIMHFMDLYNYDVMRVQRCNIHYMIPDGRLIPFCTFNVLNDFYREYVQEKYKMSLEEYKHRHGNQSLGAAIKYDRSKYIKRILSDPIYWHAYEGIVPKEKLGLAR